MDFLPPQMISSFFGGTGTPPRFRLKKDPVDALNYDYRAARVNLTSPKTVIGSSIHMLMFALSSGLLAMHAAYMECGLWTALGLNVFMALAVSYADCILVWSAQKLYGRCQVSRMTYPDVAEAAVLLCPWPKLQKAARPFRYVVEFTLAMHAYGLCVVLVVMIARSLKELVEGTEMLSDDGDPPIRVYILSLMIPCILVSMVTNLKNMAPFALIADLYAVAVVLFTIWYALKKQKESPFNRPGFVSTQKVFDFCTICVFIMETASIAIPLENNMDNPKNFHHVVIISMTTVTVLSMLIGSFGFWYFGKDAVAPITIQFPYHPFPIQLKVFLCLLLYVTFAISFYVGFDVEWFYFKRLHLPVTLWFWERLYRSFHVIIIILIAFGFPNVTRLMGIIGAFGTTPTTFLYPPLIELLLDWSYPGLGCFKWRLLKFIGLFVFGLILTICGTLSNVKGLIDEHSNSWTVYLNLSLSSSNSDLISLTD